MELEAAKKILDKKIRIGNQCDYEGTQREVKEIQKIPGTKDFLVIANEHYSYSGGPVRISREGISLFCLNSAGEIMVPGKYCERGGFYEMIFSDRETHTVFPEPIELIELEYSRSNSGFSFRSKSRSSKLRDNFFDGQTYKVILQGGKDYEMDLQTVSDKSVGVVVGEERKTRSDEKRHKILFHNYDQGKIHIANGSKERGKRIAEVNLRKWTPELEQKIIEAERAMDKHLRENGSASWLDFIV